MRFLMSAMAALAMSANVLAADRHWPLDEWPAPGLRGHGGEVKVADGVSAKSLVFDGQTTVEVNEAHVSVADAFTAAIWLNAYALDRGQQIIMAKNRYSLDEREWGLMIDRDGRIKLYVWQGTWTIVDSGHTPKVGHWQHLLVSITPTTAAVWINGSHAKSVPLKATIAPTQAPLTLGGVNDNGRIWQNLFGALDDARLYDRALSNAEATALYQPVSAVHQVPVAPARDKAYRLWSGPKQPHPSKIPFPDGIEHRTIHDAREAAYKFLHGAAIINYKGTFFANWANSPTNENYPNETLRGRRTKNPLGEWSDLEIVAPGFEGDDRHSHAAYLEHKGELWTFAARFGVGAKGKRFSGLGAEAFVLNEKTDKWESRGRVIDNCWPYDEAVLLDNGNFITGGQDKDGLPVVAISRGDDLLKKWDTVLIPHRKALEPRFAETTVWAFGNEVMAVIRGGGGVAWVAISRDYGKSWEQAQPSNLRMPRSKAYLGQLSTGQLYLVHNIQNRNTMAVSVGRPGERTLSAAYRIRHGRSTPVPRFKGHAKSPQWSYPYGYEHDGKLYVVYSIGKEDCGLSVIPISSLAGNPTQGRP